MADILKPIVVDVTDGAPVVRVDISNVTTEVSYVPDIARWHPDYLGLRNIFDGYKGEDLSGLDLSKIAPKKVGGLDNYADYANNGMFARSGDGIATLKYADCSELVRIAESATGGSQICNRLFGNASNLETVTKLENLICADGKFFYSMFGSCKKLTTISLPNLQGGENIRTTERMFSGCTKLQRLDIRSFRILKDDGRKNITYYTWMFDGVPNGCLIIVKDDATRKFIQGTMGYSNLTNIKIPSELNE